ncbi:MAG TPA: hypothetical protein DCL38_05255, partial [Lachnospiraceae bacterium]|nr:hypothetical protein [Lachnospiraceae bacterium]
LPEGVTQEVYETVPTEEEKGLPEGITQEVYETTPVVQQKELPEGVIQEVYETTQVTEQEGLSQSAQALGRSSMPDMEELDIHAEDVVSMVMPVIPEGTYDFTLDPQNLLSRYSIYKEDYEEASIYFTNSSGEKLHTGTSDPAMAVNKSSVPVLLYVELEIRNEEGWPVTYTDMDSVGENGEKNIAFSLIPVSVSETGEKILHSESRISTDESGRAEMVLLLPGSEDNFDQIGDMYVAKEDAKWSSMGFAVSGACNTDGDWREINERSDKGETMKLHITYRMDALSEEQAAQLEGGVTPDPETGVVVFE